MTVSSVYLSSQDIYSLELEEIPKSISDLFIDYASELEDGPAEWKNKIIASVKNPSEYIQNKILVLDVVKERWLEWKNSDSVQDKNKKIIEDREKQLALCAANLKLMIRTLFSKNH